jgi:hypothetical protein
VTPLTLLTINALWMGLAMLLLPVLGVLLLVAGFRPGHGRDRTAGVTRLVAAV